MRPPVRRAALAALVLGSALAGRALLRAADAPPAPKPGDTVVNSVGMKLAYVPAGEFDMGSPADEKGHEEDEARHRVRLSRSFRIGTTEVTQAQWQAVMGRRRGRFEGADLPVEDVSWNEAVAFCEKLSKAEGKTYRLPTEAEWEYACRAGAAGRFAGEPLADFAWFDDTSGARTHPVATKKPNAWGLYDVHGNVAEWCADRYAAAYPSGPITDPAGPAEGKARVVRGGSWASLERGCRCASRGNTPAAYQMGTIGLRVVMEVGGAAPAAPAGASGPSGLRFRVPRLRCPATVPRAAASTAANGAAVAPAGLPMTER